MCRSSIRISLLAALTAVLLTATSVQAQSIHIQLSSYQRGYFQSQGSGAGISADMMLLSSKEVDEIRNSAVVLNHNLAERQILTGNHSAELHTVLSNIASVLTTMRAGSEQVLSAPLSALHGATILDKQTLHVSIHFDQTLAGGILKVTADVRPVFSGIGVTNHPTASRTATESIESLTPEKVSEIVTRLTNQLTGNSALAAK